MRYLKSGGYYINIEKKVMRRFDGLDHVTDYGDIVKDFNVFSKLGCDVTGDTVHLIVDDRTGKAYFFRYPIVGGGTSSKICIDFYEVFGDDAKVEAGVFGDISPQERIKQLEEEKKNLELQIKNQEEYDKIKKAFDQLFVTRQAIIDAGFTREEAMQLILTMLPGAVNSKPLPFLWGIKNLEEERRELEKRMIKNPEQYK